MTQELLSSMLEVNPDDRMTFDDLLGDKVQSYIDFLKHEGAEELHGIQEEHAQRS